MTALSDERFVYLRKEVSEVPSLLPAVAVVAQWLNVLTPTVERANEQAMSKL